jgi:hypothetical protein
MEWKAADTLSLTPKFQRRPVWKPAARSFLIDTLLRGMPVPPVYIRQIQSDRKDRWIREVVDGQQRVRTVLEFVEDRFRLSRTLKAPWAGKLFSQLSQAEQDTLNTYGFSAEVFKGISDQDVLEMFSRLNAYAVALNKQELRNGKFFGVFKQACYDIAYEHLEFWRRENVFTENNIARMLEVEFVSEVFIAFVAGMQDKKNSIDDFYSAYDDEFKQREQIERRFREVVDDLTDATGGQLGETEFRRSPMLYSLMCAIYHYRYGLPKIAIQSPRKQLNRDAKVSLREAVLTLSERVAEARGSKQSKGLSAFVLACLTQTDNIKPRQERFATIYRVAFG